MCCSGVILQKHFKSICFNFGCVVGIYPLILCGGSGTRLWPLSRRSMPKQFLNLIGDKSLFQQASLSVLGPEFERPLIFTSNDYRFIVAQQLSDLDVKTTELVLEPSAKNTAPAILAAAEILHQKKENALLLVMPSDHYIPDQHAFIELVLSAKQVAETGAIVTFGVNPDRPETGYGYIELGEALSGSGGFKVLGFHEKPDKGSAEAMLDSGTYLWNSGIFLACCRTILAYAEELLPDMLVSVRKAVTNSKHDLDFLRLDEIVWEDIEANSIDYAILEKADNLVVFPFSGRWSDLGDWQAMRRELFADNRGVDHANNFLIGNANQIDSESCLIWSDSAEQVVTAVGLKDAIVVAMKDAVLVIDAAQTQSVKKIVDLLAAQKLSQAHEQMRQFRPWGWFETLVFSDTYQVRRVHLYPNTKMSLQTHQKRSENWIVISGVAEVRLEDRLVKLTKNQSFDVPVGTAHQLANTERSPLTLIEVRTGEYFGEDDVERL